MPTPRKNTPKGSNLSKADKAQKKAPKAPKSPKPSSATKASKKATAEVDRVQHLYRIDLLQPSGTWNLHRTEPMKLSTLLEGFDDGIVDLAKPITRGNYFVYASPYAYHAYTFMHNAATNLPRPKLPLSLQQVMTIMLLINKCEQLPKPADPEQMFPKNLDVPPTDPPGEEPPGRKNKR